MLRSCKRLSPVPTLENIYVFKFDWILILCTNSGCIIWPYSPDKLYRLWAWWNERITTLCWFRNRETLQENQLVSEGVEENIWHGHTFAWSLWLIFQKVVLILGWNLKPNLFSRLIDIEKCRKDIPEILLAQRRIYANQNLLQLFPDWNLISWRRDV